MQIDQEFAPLNVKQTKLKLILPVVGGSARRRRSRRPSQQTAPHYNLDIVREEAIEVSPSSLPRLLYLTTVLSRPPLGRRPPTCSTP